MAAVEFFVDFETVNSVNDDFSKIPEQNGQGLTFMIGCGHMEGEEWVFRCFISDRLTEEAEKPRIVHWSYAESINYEEACDSARNRHPNRGSPDVNWFDLWARVVRAGSRWWCAER